MSFANPHLLWALLLTALPVIIHLFNFKRFKKVYFSNLAFLKTVEQQTKKYSQLRHLLILAMRILFITALVLAFAKPYFPDSVNNGSFKGNKRILIYLDNSFSMQQKGRGGELLEEGRNVARSIIQSYRPVDKYKLVTNDIFSFDGGFLSRDDFMSDLRDCRYVPFSTPMSEIISASKTGDGPDKPTDVFLISDFQKSITDMQKWHLDSNTRYWLVPLASAGADNLFIDSVFLDAPVNVGGKAVKINVILKKNYETAAEDVEVKLTVNGKQKAVTTIDMLKKSKTISFSFRPDTSAVQTGIVEINDFPVNFDDVFYFSFSLRKKFSVVLINEGGEDDFISRFYRRDSSINLIVFKRDMVDYSAFRGADLIVLDAPEHFDSGLLEELKKYVFNGGKTVFIPSAQCPTGELAKFNDFFGVGQITAFDTSKIKVSEIDTYSPLFRDVFDLDNAELPANTDYPFFKYRYFINKTFKGASMTEMTLADDRALLFSMKQGKGILYYFTAALDKKNSNLGRHALFIPLFYNLVIVNGHNLPLFYRIGQDVINLGNMPETGEQVYHITDLKTGNDFIPGIKETGGETKLFIGDRISAAGNYLITFPPLIRIPLSFDYAVEESLLNNYSQKDLKNLMRKYAFKNIKLVDNQARNVALELGVQKAGDGLWKIFILLALIFLVIEVFLLGFWK